MKRRLNIGIILTAALLMSLSACSKRYTETSPSCTFTDLSECKSPEVLDLKSLCNEGGCKIARGSSIESAIALNKKKNGVRWSSCIEKHKALIKESKICISKHKKGPK